MNKLILAKLQNQNQKEAHRSWKQGWMWKGHRDIIQACRDEVRKVKAQMELNLGRGVEDNKGFYKYIDDKRKTRENASSCLRHLTVRHY